MLATALLGVTPALVGLAPALAQPKKSAKKHSAKHRAGTTKSNRSKASAAKSVKSKDEGSTETLRSAAATALPSVPSPRQSLAETEHAARYDAAIAEVRGLTLSSADADRIREAIDALGADNLARAKALRAQVQDPAGAKLIDWYSYRTGHGTASEIRAFVAANPTWPDRGTLTKRAEEALLDSAATPAEVKFFFAEIPPTSA
ncbi:MAG TPA: hypothetical protein VFY92_03850, partial [Hyphomicrobiaceae bacterium]|nr:hypothetical protein [Hyphomicrobiaceae bacterium]